MNESLRPRCSGLPIALCLCAAVAAALPSGPRAAPLPDALEQGGSGEVVQVVDGDTVALRDGRQVRLVGIQAPKLPLGRSGFRAWPLADEAKAALEALALGRTVELGYGGRRLDRHGRVLAHLATAPGGAGPGLWLQGEMLRLGLARAYSFADNRTLVPELLLREDEARRAGRGIWSEAFYAVRPVDRLGEDIGSYQLIIGRVLEVANVRGRIYLNFGQDWKTDFTVTLDPKTRRLFEDEGLDPAGYRGQTVRVRGWLKAFNGPMIEATHPEQIEVLR